MAAQYFLYNTNYGNTIVNRGDASFSPVPPYEEIYIEYLIPETQPLYLYANSGGTGGTIIVNSQANIDAYLKGTAPQPQPEDPVFQENFTGYTATTKTDIDLKHNTSDFNSFTGTTLPAGYYNKTQINGYSANTLSNINTRVYRSGDTMTGSLNTSGNFTAVGAVTGSSVSASVLMTTPVLNASTSISAPQITGSTCITSPISCATTLMRAPVVCGGTCVTSQITCATTRVQAPLICGETFVCAPAICGGGYVNSPTVSGGTTYAGSCLCSIGTTRLVGATTAASTFNVSGDTRLGANLYLDNADTGGTLNDYTVVWNPVTNEVRTIAAGGDACVYCYIDKRTIQNNTTTTNATYLTASWTLSSGCYEYEFNALFGNNSSNRCGVVCFLVNGNLVGYCNLLKTNDTNAVTTAYVTQNNTLSAGTYTPEIVFRQLGGGTASVYYGAIRIQKIGA